jgi:AcrR family transcriptional regulator
VTTSTRDAILETAGRLFVERGYAGTSVRDIAAELGIANPSLYHHFPSKGDILAELLAEPLERVATAVVEAEALTGDDRIRRILGGLLEALEVHSGVAVMALHDSSAVPGAQRDLAATHRSTVDELLGDGVADDHRHLRITMAIGAVEGVVTDLLATSPNQEDFVERLRSVREDVVETVLGILR